MSFRRREEEKRDQANVHMTSRIHGGGGQSKKKGKRVGRLLITPAVRFDWKQQGEGDPGRGVGN